MSLYLTMSLEKLFTFNVKKLNVKKLNEKPLIVYSVKCSTCNAECVGKTEMILSSRVHNNKNKIYLHAKNC